MATEPKDVGSRNRDTETTPVTNDPANKGFPAKTQEGELVFIVNITRDGGNDKKVLHTADGRKFNDDGVQGFLVEIDESTLEDSDVVEGHVVDETGSESDSGIALETASGIDVQTESATSADGESSFTQTDGPAAA